MYLKRNTEKSRWREQTALSSPDLIASFSVLDYINSTQLALTKNMTTPLVDTIAERFSITPDRLIEQGLKAFLEDQLALLTSESRVLFAKHSVQSLEEFDKLIINNPDQESALLPDFQHADFLISRIAEMKQWIAELNGIH